MRIKSSHIILSLFLALYTISYGQDKSEFQVQVEFHEQIIENPKSHDTAVANAWLHLAEVLYIENLDTILPLCRKAKRIATEGLSKYTDPGIRLNFRQCISASYNNIGYLYLQRGEMDEAIVNFNAGLKIQTETEDLEGAAISLINIGQTYDRKGELEKALNYYHESMLIQEKIGDTRGLAISLNNIAIIYKNQGNMDKALEYYNMSYELRKADGNERGMSISLNNMGTLYQVQGEYELALMYYQRSLDIREKSNDMRGVAHTLHNIGGVYVSIGEYENALDCFRRSLSIREKSGLMDEIAESQIDVANVYYQQGYLHQARQIAEVALDTIISMGFPKDIERATALLARIYEAEHMNAEALNMLKLNIEMKDSLKNDELQRAIVTQQARYSYEKQKAIDDAEHERQLLIQKEEKRIQKIITLATVGGLILLAAFLAFVFNRLRITRKQKDEIGAQKQEIEIKNNEILDSITYAKRIQTAILPSDEQMESIPHANFVYYQPKDIVAGDFYWLQDNGDKVMIAVADCTGHGVPGAMVSVVCNNGLNRAVREYGLTEAGKILDKTREIVVEEFEKSSENVKDGMDIALCTIKGNKLEYAGANNPLWVIRKGADNIEEIKADKQPIGQFDLNTPYNTHELELKKGDRFYIFSDGFPDQFGGADGKKYKAKNFKKFLLQLSNLPMNEQRIELQKELLNWMGNHEQLDDICVIGMEL